MVNPVSPPMGGADVEQPGVADMSEIIPRSSPMQPARRVA